MNYVTTVLDDALENYDNSELTTFSAPTLVGESEELALALIRYVAARFQDYWVDRLLERGLDVELCLGDLAHSIRSQGEHSHHPSRPRGSEQRQ